MNYRLQDLIDIEQFQSLQDRLNQIYAFPSAIIDNDGTILTATCWQDICTKFHRANKKSEKECIKSDRYILDHLHEANPAVSYRCPHGLIDNATPIIIEGVHYGNFFTGQFFLEKPDPAFFQERARKYGFDEKAYLAAMRKVPIWTMEQMNSYLYFIKGLIEVISSVGLKNLREIESKRQLQASEEKFRAVFEGAKDGILLLAADGSIADLNTSFAAMHGWTVEEVRKQDLGDLDTPETAARAPARMKRLLAGEPLIIEVEHYRRNGETIPLEVSANLVTISGEKHILGFHRDITERKRSEELIENILESVDEGFIIIDHDLRILSANRAYANMVAMPLENIIGRHCYEVSHHLSAPCSEAGCVCAVKKVFKTRASHASVHVHHDAKGGTAHIETKAYPLARDGSGNVLTAIETLVDITERQKLEEQLRQSQKMESIGTLAGGIAHDFNNILSAIIGYGHLALMKMAEDDPRRLNVEHMLEAADRAAHLTKDLLLFSRKQASERKPVDLNEIIQRMEKFLARIIGEDVECRTRLSGEAMPVLGDAHQLEQVLMNLATNARDAMPTGGMFTVTTEKVRFDEGSVSVHGFGKPGIYVLTTISDTGRGMDEEIRGRIFEPFFTTKEMGKGTGLGLAVVYGIIKQHDGFINVYSEPGKGTTFRVYLPLIAAGVDEKNEADEERPLGGEETILLAEDDEAVRDLTRKVLEDLGYTVITAVDGQDAVNKYRENKGRIHLLLFDIIMRGKTGKEAFDEIKAISPEVKALFTSGYAPDMVRQKVLIDDKLPVLFKPVSPTELLRQVRKTLDA